MCTYSLVPITLTSVARDVIEYEFEYAVIQNTYLSKHSFLLMIDTITTHQYLPTRSSQAHQSILINSLLLLPDC